MIITTVCVLLGLLALGVPVAAALGVLGVVLSELFAGLPIRVTASRFAPIELRYHAKVRGVLGLVAMRHRQLSSIRWAA